MRPIETLEHMAEDLDALCRADPRLIAIRERAGPLPLRRTVPGFASFVSIIVSQQVSKASAAAIFGRLAALLDPLTPRAVLEADETVFRQAGLSRPKVRTLLAVAAASAGGRLDLAAMHDRPAEEAIAAMSAVHGVGRWTAEVYLLFAAGHPDVFPARDVALQTAVGHALGLPSRPDEKALIRIAADWSPRRGAAAHLLWGYYAALKGWDAAPGEPTEAGRRD